MTLPADTIALNLRRLMAHHDLNVGQIAERSGLDERTIRAALRGAKTHTRSLHKLADGLDVPTDELFLPPSQLVYRQFDQDTNPVVDEVVAGNPGLFENWTAVEYDELYSRAGAGGGLTVDGAMEAARAMNRRRELFDKLAVVLETDQGEFVAGVIELAHEQATRGERCGE